MLPVKNLHAIEIALRKQEHLRGKLLVSHYNPRILRIIELARKKGIPVIEGREKNIKEPCLLLLEQTTPGRKEKLSPAEALKEREARWGDNVLVLVLDRITDVGNLGAVLRSADQFRVDLVLKGIRKNAPLLKSSDTSAGAASWVDCLEVSNIIRCMTFLKEHGFFLYGADMNGQPAHTSPLTGRTALIMGNEEKGLSREVRKHCDALVRIPTAGHIDSLNVSVSAGILLYEIRRQQNFLYPGTGSSSE